MSKLLNKPLKTFTLYALFVLVCSIPVYYYTVNQIWSAELDEHNQLLAEYTREKFKMGHVNTEELDKLLDFWNKVQPSMLIRPFEGEIRKDSTYTIMRADKHVSYEPVDGFRGLVTYLDINGRPYQLTIETNIEEAGSTISSITLITFLFFLILLTGFLLLNRYIAVKIWRPFQITLNKLKRFDLYKGRKLVLESSGIKEFDELNVVIERLIERNLLTFHTQKEFTENASHELQTPLAIMQSKLDLLLQENTLSKKQHQLIRELNMALARASRVNKNLLTLAKIDNNQYAEVEEINLSAELTLTLTLLSEHLLYKDIALQTNIQEGVRIKANKVLMEILIQNLIFNAYRHSLPGAIVSVSLTAKQLHIANTGREPLNIDKLFKRFSTSSKNGGTGLGLAIVKQVCASNAWKIYYTFDNGLHCFTIDFN